MSHPAPGRFLPLARHAPALNMAVDEALLRLGPTPTLRLYGWDPPGISLGRFQPGRTDLRAFEESSLPVVRRMTGGGAIVHWHEITYSVVLSVDHPALAVCDTRESYAVLHRPLQEALSDLGVEALGRGGDGEDGREGATPVLCFHRVSPLDLVVNGRKLVGSAQRRTAGRVLQHGSLVLQGNPLQTGTASLDDLLGRPPDPEIVAGALHRAFERLLGPLLPGELLPEERSFADKAAPDYAFS